MVNVWVMALENRRCELPEDPAELYELEPQHYMVTGKRRVHHTMAFRFLDKAAVREGSSKRKACTVTQVEETKLVLGMALIWLATLIPSTIWAQVNTLFVKQGTTLDRTIDHGHSFQIPAASLGSFVTISMLLSVPLYDRYFVPFMQRRTSNPRGITLLQRLGIGFAFHIAVTGVAYVVELKRMHAIKIHNVRGPSDVVPMSIFWLLPQYILLGVGDVFNAIGLLEFFYDQSPEDMQSLGTTFVTISMLLSVPLYDRYFVPFMQRRTSNPRGITLLQRLGIGFAFHIAVTGVAYVVELKRMHAIKIHNVRGPNDVVPMSIFWLLPQYILLGVGDVFNAIGLLEFFYDQSPEDMQSLGTTFFTSGIGVGNFLNSFLVTVVDNLTRRGGRKSWIGNC
ncbi:hypothetical protein J5N97_013891 [Dioscorea zingiberensis]|uniref:Uncharacterized protein n=1 Tax=Dioscorea zingiberensis TaxID=325984 RepID=A0A9D5CTU1_9LILI|nr:hypothetical protein J5N97_013891 [Dioscorea zingiberensis]